MIEKKKIKENYVEKYKVFAQYILCGDSLTWMGRWLDKFFY